LARREECYNNVGTDEETDNGQCEKCENIYSGACL